MAQNLTDNFMDYYMSVAIYSFCYKIIVYGDSILGNELYCIKQCSSSKYAIRMYKET